MQNKQKKTVTLVLELILIPRALNTGTCIQQGDVSYSAGLHRNRCQPQLTQKKLGSKCSMHGNDLLQALKGEPLSSVFSLDGTLISATAARGRGSNASEVVTDGAKQETDRKTDSQRDRQKIKMYALSRQHRSSADRPTSTLYTPPTHTHTNNHPPHNHSFPTVQTPKLHTTHTQTTQPTTPHPISPQHRQTHISISPHTIQHH